MQKLLVALLFFAAFSAHAEIPRACPAPLADEPIATVSPVSKTLADLSLKFETLYESGRRVKYRARLSSTGTNYEAPISSSSGLISIPADFLRHVQNHIEIMLKRGYGDFVFYSDLGHGHLLLPEQEAALVPQDESSLVAAALASKNLKVLYHTAELLEMRKSIRADAPLPTEPWLALRYFSRNVLADNETGENLAVLFAKPPAYNTVREVEGYREVGVFQVSASKDGCLSYLQNGKEFFFDISFRP